MTTARTWTTRNQANLGATGQAVPYPRTRTFVFAVGVAAGQRSATSTPLLNGPAIISGVHIEHNGNATARMGWALFKHTTPITEGLATIGSAMAYTPLFTPLPIVATTDSFDDITDDSYDQQNGSHPASDHAMRILIPDPTFVCGIYLTSQEAGLLTSKGHITVITDIDSSIVTSLL